MVLTEKEAEFIRWYHYLWLLIPIAGIAFFVLAVKTRQEAMEKRSK